VSLKATRDAYGEWLLKTGKTCRDIVVVDSDLSGSTRTKKFSKQFPDRFFNVGCAEQNLIGVAAGLAMGGKKVYASSFAIFETGRGWEQIRSFVAHDRLNVKLVATHAGLSNAADGASHQSLEDLALMRVIPNMRVISPCDAEETKNVLNAVVEDESPAYIRLRRENEPLIEKRYKFKLGSAQTLRDGIDLTIIATGMMVENSLKAAAILDRKGVSAKVLNVHTIKPIDKETIVKVAKETGAVITAENHSIIGGLGSTVAEVLSETYPIPIYRVGIRDRFGQSAISVERLFQAYQLTAQDISIKAEKLLQRKE